MRTQPGSLRLQNPRPSSSGGVGGSAGARKSLEEVKTPGPPIWGGGGTGGPIAAFLLPGTRWRLCEQKEKKAQGLRAPGAPTHQVLI